jgi:hypothetical protein
LFFTLSTALIIGGCASTGKMKGPSDSESTLLIGRIMMECSDFPANWRANGKHTRGIVVDLQNMNTDEVFSTKSSGADGLFQFMNLAAGEYRLIAYSREWGFSSGSTTLGHWEEQEHRIRVRNNTVTNIGDVHLWMKFETIEEKNIEKAGVSTTTARVRETCYFRKNFEEVRSWFASTYPESSWNEVDWISIEY